MRSLLTRNEIGNVQKEYLQQNKKNPDEAFLANINDSNHRDAFNSSPCDFSHVPVALSSGFQLQKKLTINQPGDQYEQEADRVADLVMSMPEASVQRKWTGSEHENSGPISRTLQRVSSSGSSLTAVPSVVSEVIASSGAKMPSELRANMESRFGYDFSHVRIHTDSTAEQSASAVRARAFAVGNHVVFGRGEFQPGTDAGQRLLAHELTHTIQQSAGSAGSTISNQSGTERLQRVSFDECEVLEGPVRDAHNYASAMLDRTIAALRAYDGSQVAVRDALNKHFHSSSQFTAFVVANHMTSVSLLCNAAQYECHDQEENDNALASTIWCVPFTDISLWKPWFSLSIEQKANTLIHEWMHKYDCSFDLGYSHEPEYKDAGWLSSIVNAEPYGELAMTIGKP